jgi:molybdopterin-guanine dinucleotide biosynthesis protein A
MEHQNITGIVLAGGKSSRMGTDKSLLLWRGKTFVEHAIDALKPLCGKVVISSNKSIYDFTGCETWPDELPMQAPMVGIYSCLKRSQTETNIFLSCDMPHVTTDLLRYLTEHSENNNVLVAVHDENKIEPLCGIYKRNVIEEMEKSIKNNNLSLYKYIHSYSSPYVIIDEKLSFYNDNLFANINTLEDFKNLR